MSTTDHTRAVLENVQNANRAIRAYADFHDRVAAIAIDMALRNDPAALLLLDAMKDLNALTGDLFVTEENK